MSSDVPLLTFGGGTALTGNANCVKKTKKTEIGHVTMNIQEACGIIWTYNGRRADVNNLPFYHVGNKDSARQCCWETCRKPYPASTMEFNNLLHTMSLLCR